MNPLIGSDRVVSGPSLHLSGRHSQGASCHSAPGRDGTAFVTIEDETGDVRGVARQDLFARRNGELERSQGTARLGKDLGPHPCCSSRLPTVTARGDWRGGTCPAVRLLQALL